MKSEYPFRSTHTVMSYELDAWGHVNNAVYLNYLEKARNDFMMAKGLGFNHFFEWGRFPVVRRARLDFKRPATAGDCLSIAGRVSRHTEASFTLSYRMTLEATGLEILTAETLHVFVDKKNRPARIPVPFFTNFIANSS